MLERNQVHVEWIGLVVGRCWYLPDLNPIHVERQEVRFPKQSIRMRLAWIKASRSRLCPLLARLVGERAFKNNKGLMLDTVCISENMNEINFRGPPNVVVLDCYLSPKPNQAVN